MSSFSVSSVYAQLTSFAKLENFWSLFDTAFGSSYDFATAASFRSQWQSGDFSLFPQIEVISSDVLGSANGAYAISTNRIYLSDQFVSTASQQSLEAVILEEFGHFVDAQINAVDTAGDEGELFSAVVLGQDLSPSQLALLKAEDDRGIISLNGQNIQIEQDNPMIVVNNTNDSGEGSLRWAIEQANNTPGIDRIVFNIGDAGVQTIRPLSALPIIVEAVTIDGTTQPGYAGTPIVEIDGSQAGQTSGITLVGGSTIKGLVINRFADIAITAEGGPDNPTTTIQGNYIGTDVTGIIALGNGQSGHTGGLLIGSNVVLGGSNLQDRNIISGNYSAGIFLRGSNITVEGNYIGVGATGEPLGNQGFGIENSYDSPNNIIRNNLIASNTSTGISIRDRGGHLIENNIIENNQGDGILIGDNANNNLVVDNLISGNDGRGIAIFADNNRVQDNYIGTDITGTIALSNNLGIEVVNGDNNILEDNLVSGNNNAGIGILSYGDIANNNQVINNYIGTNKDGTSPLGNGNVGIDLPSAVDTLLQGNVIGGNAPVGISLRGSQRTIVENNFIGTDATGTINLGNQGSGIADDSNAIDRVIRNNIIGFNQGSGIFLEGTGHLIESNQIYAKHKGIAVGNSGLNNEILGNGIHNNTELGIDLSNNGVTPNDLGDGDAGANNSQNYPILTSVTANNIAVFSRIRGNKILERFTVQDCNTPHSRDYRYNGTTITGMLNSQANQTYRIEFFVNDSADPLGYGEGKTYLDFVEVTTDNDGNANFNVSLSTQVAVGAVVVATATSPQGNTSEFSAVVLPTDLALSNNTIAENQAIGTAIGTLTSTAPDTGNTFIYSLVTGTGSTDNTLFAIAGNQLQSNGIFDFETKNSYNIRVRTTDQGGLTFEKQLTIGVTDLNEIQGNPSINNGRNPIVGTAGPDYLTGGAGAKTLTGGGGNDSFVFTNMRDVGQRIADFTVGEDKLVFAQLFSSLGYTGSDPIADGYIKFVQGTGSNSAHTFLQIDRDGLTGSAIARNFLQVDNITPTQLNNSNNFQF